MQVSLYLEARNGNAHSAANFTRLQCRIKFVGATLAGASRRRAVLRARQGHRAAAIRGGHAGHPVGRRQERHDGGRAPRRRRGVRRGGEARTRREVTGLVYINKRTRLAYEIRFIVSNGTALPFHCTSKSKFLFF